MRDIKFRAWRKGEMYDGLGIEKLLSMAAKVGFEDNAISPVIWMQYTGLKDKNDVEIYEGDIVSRIEMGQTLKVSYSCDVGGFIFINTDGSMYIFDVLRDYEYEVIGNTHQNPELLGN